MRREKPTHFATLELALKELMFMEFNRVLEYRIIYTPPKEKRHEYDTTEPEFWTVKRKIMSYNAFGKTAWSWL